jgi:hypothetical protein
MTITVAAVNKKQEPAAPSKVFLELFEDCKTKVVSFGEAMTMMIDQGLKEDLSPKTIRSYVDQLGDIFGLSHRQIRRRLEKTNPELIHKEKARPQTKKSETVPAAKTEQEPTIETVRPTPTPVKIKTGILTEEEIKQEHRGVMHPIFQIKPKEYELKDIRKYDRFLLEGITTWLHFENIKLKHKILKLKDKDKPQK